MFIPVKTKFEEAIFKELFQQAAHLRYNERKGDEQRYLLLKSELDPSLFKKEEYEAQLRAMAIGTVEMNLFNSSGHSLVQQYVKTDLSLHPAVVGRENGTYEVGKLYIKREFQNKGYFRNFMLVMLEHTLTHGAQQFLAVMVVPLYTLCKRKFGDAIEQIAPIDDDVVPGVPVRIDMEKMLKTAEIIRLADRYSRVPI